MDYWSAMSTNISASMKVSTSPNSTIAVRSWAFFLAGVFTLQRKQGQYRLGEKAIHRDNDNLCIVLDCGAMCTALHASVVSQVWSSGSRTPISIFLITINYWYICKWPGLLTRLADHSALGIDLSCWTFSPLNLYDQRSLRHFFVVQRALAVGAQA